MATLICSKITSVAGFLNRGGTGAPKAYIRLSEELTVAAVGLNFTREGHAGSRNAR